MSGGASWGCRWALACTTTGWAAVFGSDGQQQCDGEGAAACCWAAWVMPTPSSSNVAPAVSAGSACTNTLACLCCFLAVPYRQPRAV